MSEQGGPWSGVPRGADSESVGRLVERDYSISELMALVAASTAQVEAVIILAWRRLLRDISVGRLTPPIRPALLGMVLDILDEESALDDSEVAWPTPAYAFAGEDDRWAGWWEEEPPPWAESLRLDRAWLVRALRRLPLELRVLLVLRDAAAVEAKDAEAIVHCSPDQQRALLDLARAALVGVIDATETPG